MVRIEKVEEYSSAAKAGILAGDELLCVNGHEITDVLDYRFYLTEKKVTLTLSRNGETYEKTIRKGEYDDIGLEFETYLMSEKRSCRNKCIFCFIDQLPPGMRKTLYFKDDDSRLSFLMGNYITLTNLTESDIDRIVKMKMSPVNISVHTTDPFLRERMTGNRFAGDSLKYLKTLADGGIRMNGQIVLCRSINDGEALDKTMHDLAELYPAVQSVSVVPAGLTKYREGLTPLSPFSPEEAKAVLSQVGRFADRCRKEYGVSLFYCADEWYLKAGVDLPSEEEYDDYPQIENGVGMIRSMQTEFDEEMEFLDEYDLLKKRRASIATGEAAFPFVSSLAERLMKVIPSLSLSVYCIKNNFFGEQITVSGLLTGQDLFEQLKDKDLGEVLFLPANCTESTGEKFLDDLTVSALEEKLGTPIRLSRSDGHEFIRDILY